MMIMPRISRLNHNRATPPRRRRSAQEAHARPPRRKRWSEERVKQALRSLAAKGEPVNPTRAGLPLYYAARAYFGSFAAACEAAGLEMGRERKWSEDAIRAALRRLARSGPITSKRVPYPLRKACRRYAGSLAKACEAAGVEVDPRLLRQRRRWNRRLV